MAAFRQKLQHSKLGASLQGDLKSLAELIAAEKSVLTTTIRMAQDTQKASSALRDFGTQSQDFDDVLSKISFLFDQLAKAKSQFAQHESTVRLHYKTLRTREENFITLRKSKDALQNRIDSAERQLGKTSAEHKERSSREARLFELRSEMSALEQSVLNEEARLGDFRRNTIKEAILLKLGAMLELAEKETVVAEMGKLLIAELPTGVTQPGTPRPAYNGKLPFCVALARLIYHDPAGYASTEEIMQEAQRCLSSVVFNPDPNAPLSLSASRLGTSRPSGPTADDSFASTTVTDEPSYQDSEEPRQRRTSVLYDGMQQPENQLSQTSLAPTNYTLQTDNRSSLAYMDETPDSEPAPVATKDLRLASPPALTLSGPPSAYSASNGVPRHGVRDEPNSQYPYEESASWARNHSQSPEGPPAIPQLPNPPSHFATAPALSLDGTMHSSFQGTPTPSSPMQSPKTPQPSLAQQQANTLPYSQASPKTPQISQFASASYGTQSYDAPYSSQQAQPPYPPQQSQTPYSPQQAQAPYSPQQPEAPYSPQQPEAPYSPQQPEAPYSPQQPEAPYSPQQYSPKLRQSPGPYSPPVEQQQTQGAYSPSLSQQPQVSPPQLPQHPNSPQLSQGAPQFEEPRQEQEETSPLSAGHSANTAPSSALPRYSQVTGPRAVPEDPSPVPAQQRGYQLRDEQPSRSYSGPPKEKERPSRRTSQSTDSPRSPVGGTFPPLPAPPYPLTPEETSLKLSQSLPVAPPRLSNPNLIYTPAPPKPDQPVVARKKAVRADSALGSRYGFDDPAYKAKDDPNNLSQSNYFPGVTTAPTASTPRDNTAAPAGYTYHRPADPPKITASAFRGRVSAAGREAAYPEGSVSPAAAIREAYLQQQQIGALVDENLPPTAPLKLVRKEEAEQ